MHKASKPSTNGLSISKLSKTKPLKTKLGILNISIIKRTMATTSRSKSSHNNHNHKQPTKHDKALRSAPRPHIEKPLDEQKAVLPKRETGIGKNRRVVQVGLGNTIYTTEQVPVLDFSADFANSTPDAPTPQQYKYERQQQEEKLAWEKDVTQLKKMKVELEKSKKNVMTKQASSVLPGIEMTPELLEESQRLLEKSASKNKKNKKVTTDAYNQQNQYNDEELQTDDYDQMFEHDTPSHNEDDNYNNKKVPLQHQDSDNEIGNDISTTNNKKKYKQHEPEAIEERLTLKEQEIVQKLRIKAHQAGLTPIQYCNRNGLYDMIHLLQRKMPLDETKNKMKKNYDNDDENDSNSIRVLNEIADLSDDDDYYTKGNNNDNDIQYQYDDALDIQSDDYYDDDNDDVIQNTTYSNDGDNTTYKINPTHSKLSQIAKNAQKQSKTGKTTIELGNLVKPSIIIRDDGHSTNFNLHSFNQLQQTISKGIMLNPKSFQSKSTQPSSTTTTTENDENNNENSLEDNTTTTTQSKTKSTTLTTTHNNDQKGPSFIHRTRPSIPDASWLDLGLNPAIVGKLTSAMMKNPTATQKLAIPYLVRRFNQRTGKIYIPPTVAIQDYTGSGKTLAYGLPLLTNINPSIASKVPPPQVISAIRALQGIKLPNPPPLEVDNTPLDEVDPNVRVLQYKDDQTYNNPRGIDPYLADQNAKKSRQDKILQFHEEFDNEDIVDNDYDTLLQTKNFLDRISNEIDIFNMTSDEWEAHVFKMEKLEQQEANLKNTHQTKIISTTTTKSNPDGPLGTGQIDVKMFNSRVYSLEALRVRRKKKIQQHLRKIFPFIPTDLLDPDAPQSTLQSIIIVPTKELALQITKELNRANPSVWISDVPKPSSHRLYGDKNFHITPHSNKNTIHVRMATGQIDPVLLGSLGVFLHKAITRPNTDAEKNDYNKPVRLHGGTLEQLGDKKMTPEQKKQHQKDQEEMRQHPFVEFGKNSKFYHKDQDEYRRDLREREKEHTIRVMRLRERQMQGEKLTKFEIDDMETLDEYESRRIAIEQSGQIFDPEMEYQKTLMARSEIDFNEFTNTNVNNFDDNDDALVDPTLLDMDPKTLLELDDATLMKKLDLLKTDYTKSKQYKLLSPQEKFQLKGRLASVMTKAHLYQQDAERNEALKKINASQAANGRPQLQMGGNTTKNNKYGGIDENNGDYIQQQINNDLNKKNEYLREVSDLLLEQMGGEKGDYVEVAREKQPHILVGTPTTIVNLIKSGAIQLPSTTSSSPNQLKSIIFDECDHLARNETSLEHYALLELLSLPSDQATFVSASMTRDTARLLTRLAKRQDLFINNKKPQIETVTNMIALPRPPYKAIPDDVIDIANEEAFNHAQLKVNTFNMAIEQEPTALHEIVLSSPRAKKERIKVLSDQLQDESPNGGKQQLLGKLVDTIYKQNFTPVLPSNIFTQHLQQSINRGRLSYVTAPDEYGEVLFLSSDDYRTETQPNEYQLLTTTSNEDQLHDPHVLPIPPFVKQYYIAPPRLTTLQQKVGGHEDPKQLKSNSYLKRVLKDNLALDLICQLKLRPLKQGNENAKITYNDTEYDKLLQQHNANNTNTNDMINDITSLSNDITNNEQLLDVGNGTNTTPSHQLNKKSRPSKSLTASEVCPGTILVFFNPRREDDMIGLFRQLKETGLNVGIYCSTSDRHQKYEVLVKNKDLDVILTNDSLSRGLDFKTVSTVINVDPPRATTTFIHRSGRVGRVGGKYRKAAMVINIVDVIPTNNDDNINTTTTNNNNNNNSTNNNVFIPKQTATYSLLQHAQRTNVTIQPWPYVVTHNISRVYLRSLKAIVASDTEKQGIKKFIDRRRKTEEYQKARNVKLHKMGIIQTRDTGVFDLAPGYNDSSFQPQLGKKSQSVAIHRIQAKVNQQLRGRNTQPWIQTDEKKGGKKHKTIKH